jgi:hypothetical protein
MQSCLVILRVMRDICRRIPVWNVVSDWVGFLVYILYILDTNVLLHADLMLVVSCTALSRILLSSAVLNRTR